MNHSARRDDGLQRISTLTRWVAGGAIVLAGVFSAVVAKALPGRSSSSGGAAQAGGTSATTAPANAGGAVDDGSSLIDPGVNDPSQFPDTLAPPPQLPARSGGRHTSTVVSGGS